MWLDNDMSNTATTTLETKSYVAQMTVSELHDIVNGVVPTTYAVRCAAVDRLDELGL